jgi:signal peptidase II
VRPPPAAPWLAGLATVVWIVVADQATKLWALGADGQVDVRHNPGYALGLISGSVPVLVVGTLAVLGVFAAVVVPLAHRVGLPAWIPGLVLGGALSNVVDRVRFGAVRDFVVTRFGIFNLADLCVVAGVLILPALLALRVARAARTAR